MDSVFEKIISERSAKSYGDSWKACCPVHPDKNPSLSIKQIEGKILFKCFAGCSQDSIIDYFKQIGLWKKAAATTKLQEVAIYDYCNESGESIYQVVRYQPKTFRQRRLNKSASGWINNIEGIRPVPFRLPQIIKAIQNKELIFIVEGEKDVISLERLGVTATCNSGGAGRWTVEHSRYLAGASIVILPDNDLAGQKHVLSILESLKEFAGSIRVLEIPDLPEKGDVSDWIKQHQI